MLAKSNEALPRTRDPFFDDDDEEDGNPPSPNPQLISSIRIVTSKPPVYRRQSQSSNSPSPSSCGSDHDVTDVSSLGNDHRQARQQQQHDQHQRKANHERHNPFHLQNMRHVLLGSSAPTSRPPSPAHPQEQLNKKHVRIVADEIEKNHQNHSNHHHHHNHNHQQPYIHGHTRDYRRVRLTSSAINRQKQQQKIERENLVRQSRENSYYIVLFHNNSLFFFLPLIDPLTYTFVQLHSLLAICFSPE